MKPQLPCFAYFINAFAYFIRKHPQKISKTVKNGVSRIGFHITSDGKNITVCNIDSFSLDDTLDSGQCFRWNKNSDGSYFGIAGNRPLRISSPQPGTLVLHNVREADAGFWINYFDLNCDYKSIKKTLSADPTLKKAVEMRPGLRILRQDPLETTLSFIISQNNNIKRIKLIIEIFCQNFGKPIPNTNRSAFPTIDSLQNITIENLAVIKSGFRDKYIVDAVSKILNNSVPLDKLHNLAIEQARNTLMQIRGIGPKVADCILLFGYHNLDACPIDVWMKRILAKYYGGRLPDCTENLHGIAQQYLFEYERNNSPDISKSENVI